MPRLLVQGQWLLKSLTKPNTLMMQNMSQHYAGQYEGICQRYFKLLGESEQACITNELLPIPKATLLEALNLVFPENEQQVSFRNPEQEGLIKLSDANSTQHVFALIGCWAGKSLCAYLPTVASSHFCLTAHRACEHLL